MFRASLFRGVLAAAFLFSCGVSAACAAEPPAAAAPAAAQTLELKMRSGQAFAVKVWAAPAERAVIVFDPGAGGQPERYGRIVAAWTQAGFTVIAPVHVDGLARGDLSGSNGPDSFAGRIEQLAIVRGFAQATHPGKPLVAAGHSFGSLMSLVGVGAATPAGAQADRSVTGVIAFSSPGLIPGLLTADSYKAVASPLLMITGDADVVPGFAPDWHAHRAPFDTSVPGDKTLLLFEGGAHDLIANAKEADFGRAVAATIAFVEAYGLGDAGGKAHLAALKSGDGLMVERR